MQKSDQSDEKLQLERERFEFERQKHNDSIALERQKHEQLTAIEREKIENEKKKNSIASLTSPVTATLIVALVGLGGTGLGAFFSSRATLELQKREFETKLIVKGIETGDRDVAARNLSFFVEAGFINDPEGKIAKLAKNPSSSPVLPATVAPTGGLAPDGGYPRSTPVDTIVLADTGQGDLAPPQINITII